MKTVIVLLIAVWSWGICGAQDSIPRALLNYRHYKETVVTFGYNYNFGEKEDGKRPKSLHFLEVGVWRTHAALGHHPVYATWYGAADFGLNTDKFTVAPKVGGFVGVMVLGMGMEFVYYTNFDEGSFRFHWQLFGYFTPYFKLAFGVLAPITNKDFNNMDKNMFMVNLTVRAFKIKRTDL